MAADERSQAENDELEAEEEERRSLSVDRGSAEDSFSNPLASAGVNDSLTVRNSFTDSLCIARLNTRDVRAATTDCHMSAYVHCNSRTVSKARDA